MSVGVRTDLALPVGYVGIMETFLTFAGAVVSVLVGLLLDILKKQSSICEALNVLSRI
jgi:hypothetical protein